GFAMLGILVIGNFVSAFAVWLTIRFVWRKNYRLSLALLKKYLFLPYAYFLNQHSADLGKNVLYEAQQFTDSFLLPFLRIITGVMVAVIIFAILFYVNPLLTLIAAVFLTFLYLLIYSRFSQEIRIGGERRLEENKGKFKAASEALGGIKDIKVLGREKYFLQRFSKHSEKLSDLCAWCNVVSGIPHYIMEIVAFGGVIGLILFLLSKQTGQQIIPLVGFFTFAGYRLISALQGIFQSFTIFRFNKAVLDKIYKDMTEGGINTAEIIFDKELPQPLPFKKNIKLGNISFSYPGMNSFVLKDINLEIKKNTSIGIVGPTGSGKTTLVDIILGLFIPNKGIMKVDDIGINEKNIRNWQRNLGYVPQQVYLSDDTISRNIAFGLPDEKIDMAQVKLVAEIANIDNFIKNELPNGYETIVGERGIRLSGGQKQRIGIARSLYHDPEVIVFDEATSSLDGVMEKAVLEAMQSVSKIKTLIIIAHRLTTVRNCDIIYLIDKGRITSQGTYNDLMKNNIQFQAMARKVG
ncbi:ABC transporter ATP-binding protein/permease, partial [Patescibacteria group bacterium]|nr:ABC transporter ATP-binding protein/permease [Patescibacteria group bacterium]